MLRNEESAALDKLREKVSSILSGKRLIHTYEVEKMACRLCEIYCPEKEYTIRAAVLLHDITKQLDTAEQIQICIDHGECAENLKAYSPKIFHSRTAAMIIPEKFSEYASEEVVNAVRYHTTGKADMNICEKIVYFSDYIDMSRTYEDCVYLRNLMFCNVDFDSMTENEKLEHLNICIIKSFDMTLISLIENGELISDDTVNARNYLICEMKNKNNTGINSEG